MDGQHFIVRFEILDFHSKGMIGSTAHAAAEAGIFEGMGNLRPFCVKVLELGTSFAAENLLEPAPTRLAHFHVGSFREV
jgi:hypothetical protein